MMNEPLLCQSPALRRFRISLNACISVTLLMALAPPTRSHAAEIGETNWPQFRGPNAAGVSTNPHLPDRWTAATNVAWKADLPGRSSSSPVAWGNRVFLTAVVNSGESEPPKKGLYFGGDPPGTAPVRASLEGALPGPPDGSASMGKDSSSRYAANGHPLEEQLWRGDARDGWGAGLRTVRQRRRFCLHGGWQ